MGGSFDGASPKDVGFSWRSPSASARSVPRLLAALTQSQVKRAVAMFPAVRFALFATAKLARKDKQLAHYSKLTSTPACYAMRLDPA
jgi:hypothetical protein